MNWFALRNWLMIRQGEGSMIVHLAIVAMLVGGGLAIGRGSSDALFFKRFGTEYLPHMFYAYNNRIAATASEVEVKTSASGARLLWAKDLQIVNGAQTASPRRRTTPAWRRRSISMAALIPGSTATERPR